MSTLIKLIHLLFLVFSRHATSVQDLVAPDDVEQAACWSNEEEETGLGFNFESCCKMLIEGIKGNPRCWDESFTYERCCLPELWPRVRKGMAMLHDGKVRESSRTLFDLAMNFATREAGNSEIQVAATQAFSKAAKAVVSMRWKWGLSEKHPGRN